MGCFGAVFCRILKEGRVSISGISYIENSQIQGQRNRNSTRSTNRIALARNSSVKSVKSVKSNVDLSGRSWHKGQRTHNNHHGLLPVARRRPARQPRRRRASYIAKAQAQLAAETAAAPAETKAAKEAWAALTEAGPVTEDSFVKWYCATHKKKAKRPATAAASGTSAQSARR